MIEQKADIGDAAGDHGLPARFFLGFRFAVAAGEFRGDHLRVVEGGDDVSMAAQVRAEERGSPAGSAAVVREDDQRISASERRRVANSGLLLFGGAEARSEAILSVRVKVMAGVVWRCRIPDFAGEKPVASLIASFEAADAYRKASTDEGVVDRRVRLAWSS